MPESTPRKFFALQATDGGARAGAPPFMPVATQGSVKAVSNALQCGERGVKESYANRDLAREAGTRGGRRANRARRLRDGAGAFTRRNQPNRDGCASADCNAHAADANRCAHASANRHAHAADADGDRRTHAADADSNRYTHTVNADTHRCVPRQGRAHRALQRHRWRELAE